MKFSTLVAIAVIGFAFALMQPAEAKGKGKKATADKVHKSKGFPSKPPKKTT